MTRNILAMKAAIERQVANSNIQHSNIDQNRHAINEQSEVLRFTTRSVIRNENRLNVVDNELMELETYMELDLMFESIDEILESLVDIKRDSKTGRCNEKGLNPDFLIDNLRELESNKDSIAPVFASWEWQMYYRHEMCTVALHEDELWITLQIPIVNLRERFVRAIPLSNQIWIRDTFYELGFEISLFRHKHEELFMVATKSNIELCSKLGTARVCSMRKSKFRESNPFAVPFDINHNRVLIITNNTKDSFEGKSICSNSIVSLSFVGQTTTRIPEKCTLVSKSFEVSKIPQNSNLNTTNDIDKIETVKLRHMMQTTKTNYEKELRDITKLPSLLNDTLFELNNKKTLDELNTVTVKKWSTESLFFTTSGSCATLLVIVIVTILLIRCIKNSVKKSANSVVINLETQREREEQENVEKGILFPADNENADKEIRVPEQTLDKDKKRQDSTSRPMCHFNRN